MRRYLFVANNAASAHIIMPSNIIEINIQAIDSKLMTLSIAESIVWI